ncbi:MAG: hypothetical protein HYR55_02710 [Acidobacteria bacterium]|nr:hypothetical protein [Acidobacteriota bacterium]MBI3654956.1 hypothetical protein [Acidobacteriota bacterium]
MAQNGTDPWLRFGIHLGGPTALAQLLRSRPQDYDGLVLFFSGDPSYHKIKALALVCGLRRILVFKEDLDSFFFSVSGLLRFLALRLRHGVKPMENAADAAIVPERVLVLQSAALAVIERALTLIRQRGIFRDPQISLFLREGDRCRANFADYAYEPPHVLSHAGMENTWAHWRAIRHARYDAVVLFLTGDPSFWKIKVFAFLCGAKRLLIFNEHYDCFFYTPTGLISFLMKRWRQRVGTVEAAPHAIVIHALIRVARPLLYPFRFAYLLLFYWTLELRRFWRSPKG